MVAYSRSGSSAQAKMTKANLLRRVHSPRRNSELRFYMKRETYSFQTELSPWLGLTAALKALDQGVRRNVSTGCGEDRMNMDSADLHSIICPVFIGRTTHLQALRHLIEQACVSQGQMVLVAGEAGIGKSRL